MKLIKIFFLGAALAFLTQGNVKAEFNENGMFEISSDFSGFNSENFKGYTKPLFTTIGQGAQSNLFSVANYNDSYSIGLDISLSSTLIPGNQGTYNAMLPAAFGDTSIMDNAIYKNGEVIRNISRTIEQPTIYGGESNAIYVVAPVAGGDPADSIYKSIAYNEGNNITTMASLPAIQFIFGLPTRTEIRFRYLGAPIDDEMYNHLAVSANQQVDEWFDMFDSEDNMSLAIHGSYQFMTLAESIDMNSWAAGVHFSKGFGDGLSVYTGIQLEDLGGTFNVARQNGYQEEFYVNGTNELKQINEVPTELQAQYAAHVVARSEVENSPFEEVRLLKPISFDIETFTNWRFTVGGAYEYGIMEFHLDVGYASQMFLNGGIRLRFKEWTNSSDTEN
jgi:hypothetical protein